MSILPIYLEPHTVLHKKAKPVEAVTDEIKTLLDDMAETVIHLNGVGLAANQVGDLRRVIVIDGTYCGKVDEDADIPAAVIKFVNPEIVWSSDELAYQKEGCFSVPHVYTDVERPASIELKYLDENGKEQSLKTKPGSLFNAAIQHEIDHLDGVLFPDRISKLKQKMVWKKYDRVAADFDANVQYAHVSEKE